MRKFDNNRSIVAPKLAELGIENPHEFLTEMRKTMSIDEMAEQIGINSSSLMNYCNKHDIRAPRTVRPLSDAKKAKRALAIAEGNNENKVKTFLCVACHCDKSIELLSVKKDVCQRCLKNQIRSRV